MKNVNILIDMYNYHFMVVFVLGVKENWNMFYTSDGVWQLKKIKSNRKLMYLTVK